MEMIIMHRQLRWIWVFCVLLLLTSTLAAQTPEELMISLWSPDGTMIATGSLQGHLRIWNINGTFITDQVRTGAISELSWSPDSTRIALPGPGNTVDILNVTLPSYSV